MVVIDTAERYSAYLGAIRDGDRRRAFQVIDDARDAGLALGTICLDVLQHQRGHGVAMSRTILLVEDNTDNRIIYRRELEHFGYGC